MRVLEVAVTPSWLLAMPANQAKTAQNQASLQDATFSYLIQIECCLQQWVRLIFVHHKVHGTLNSFPQHFSPFGPLLDPETCMQSGGFGHQLQNMHMP